MIRYNILMRKVGAILNGGGFIQKVVARGIEGTVVVIVKVSDQRAFDSLLDNDTWVVEYSTSPAA